MRKWNRLGVLAAIILLPSPIAAVQANMPPPEPFALGIVVAKDNDGMRITSIQPGSHAERAQLMVGDVVIGVDGHWVKGMTKGEQQNAFVERHMWSLEMIVVRNHHDILAIKVRG